MSILLDIFSILSDTYIGGKKIMNYTKTIRNYINDNKGGFFEITYEHSKYFQIIPAKTLMKVLNRLEEDGLLLKVAKGLYFINDGTEYSEEKLISYYGESNRGIVIGYPLYNKLEISNHKDNETIIYTNELGIKSKTVGKIQLKKMNLFRFEETEKSIITALEILDKGFDNIIDCDVMKTIQVLQQCVLKYNDFAFEMIIKNHKYCNTTVFKLSEQLQRLLVSNKCLIIYLKILNEN